MQPRRPATRRSRRPPVAGADRRASRRPEHRGHADHHWSSPIPRFESDTLFAPYRDHRHGAAPRPTRSSARRFAAARPRCKWVLPPELRKIAPARAGHRGRSRPDGPGGAALAQAARQFPTRSASSLRNLMAVVGGRIVMVPAVARLRPRGRRADPGRAHRWWWPTRAPARCSGARVPYGSGATPDEALDAALTAALPLDVGGP